MSDEVLLYWCDEPSLQDLFNLDLTDTYTATLVRADRWMLRARKAEALLAALDALPQ